MAIKELNATEPHTEKWLKRGNPCRSSGQDSGLSPSEAWGNKILQAVQRSQKKNTFLMVKVDFTLCIFYHNLKKKPLSYKINKV